MVIKNLNSCDSVVYKNVVYKSSFSFIDTIRSAGGCDSVYNSINIMIGNLSISGRIYHPSTGYSIPDVSANINGSVDINTIATGSYSFNCLPQKANETVRLYKNNEINKANGVTTLDVALIQSLILAKSFLNSPFKILAADVSGDKKVTALDIVYIKRLILGVDTTYPGKKLWNFVDSSYKFADSTLPFPYKDSVSYTGLSANKNNQTFVGYKLGDVNWDWNPAIAKPQINNINAVELNYNPTVFRDNEEIIKVPVMVKNFKDMLGIQFAINFDATLLQWKGISNNTLGIEMGTTHANDGSISFLWVDPKNEIKTLDDGNVLFELLFKKNDNGQLIIDNLNTNILKLDGSVTSVVAYDKDYQSHNVVFKPSLINLSDSKNVCTVFPNPAKGLVNITGKNISTIKITDINGKLLLLKSKIVSNNSFIDLHSISKGVYIMKVQFQNGGETCQKLLVE